MEEQMDILLLQEPYSVRGNIPGFGLGSKVIVGQGVPMAAVVVLSEEFDCVVMDEASNSHCVMVELVGKGLERVVVISAYFQFGEPVVGHLEWLERGLRGLARGYIRCL